QCQQEVGDLEPEIAARARDHPRAAEEGRRHGREHGARPIERLGLGYDEVRKVNPGIIYCQVKGFGTGSPYEHSLAFDMIAQAAGGTISVTGDADRAPVKPGPSFGDTGTGMLMAISILGALYGRSKTGRGRRLQVAMQDAMLHYMRVPFSRTQLTGKAMM